MFSERTTLILGAGASCGYGYPIGHDLIDRIIEVCKGWSASNANGNAAMYGDRLGRALRFYDPLSIDSFLFHYEQDQHLVAWAKIAIGKILFESARMSEFERRPNSSENWYRLLWNAIVAGSSAEELASEHFPLNLNIVTFNYDVSLEAFLYSRVTQQDSFFRTPQLQGAFLRKLSNSIHHVYGKILDYKWCGGTDSDSLYQIDDERLRNHYIDACQSRILLVNERSASQYQAIRQCIQDATRIFFLGFAFDETNIGEKVLSLEETLAPRPIKDGPSWVPDIKYTNLNDSEIINRKMSLLVSQGGTSCSSVHKSTKRVYQALSEDFSLN